MIWYGAYRLFLKEHEIASFLALLLGTIIYKVPGEQIVNNVYNYYNTYLNPPPPPPIEVEVDLSELDD